MSNRKKRRNVQESMSKKNKWKWICLVMLIATIVIYYQVFGLIKYTLGRNVTEGQISLYKWVIGYIDKAKDKNKNVETSLNIAVLGNIKANGRLIDSYSEKGIVNYNSIFNSLSFKEYDYTIANLNTSIVLDAKPEGEFYANSKLLQELKNININMLITATKELGEQKKETVKETLEELNKFDIDCVGAKDNSKNSYYILNKNNIKIGILAYVDKDYVKNDSLKIYSNKQLKKDINELRKEEVDLVILFIDALRNSKDVVSDQKKSLLKELLKEGVDIVISSDEVEQQLYKNNDNTTYIKYSLGDLLGPQDISKSDISKVLKINIEKRSINGKITIDIEVDNDKTLVALSNQERTKYKIVDLDKEILGFDESSGRVSLAEYNYLKEVKENIDK